ncbi:MAG: methyltransferase domain-containing protein [Candidatus Aenigmarchaeota archaeon]|nr:methyltransferase domain-containing protein [Candidatus Aenigmarchaeota archaeon]
MKNRLAVFFPSSKQIITVVMEFADIKSDDIFYDLGSGDGRILIEAAKKKIPVVGIEKNRFLNWIAKRRIRRLNLKNVRIIQGDIFDQDINEATIIVAYLSSGLAHRLQKKIEKEVKKGTSIILIDHSFKGWKPIKERRVGFIPVRLYVK